MSYISEDFNKAVNDFILGNGKDIPNKKVCETLINNHPVVNKFISDAINKKIAKISIMPYGNELHCYNNPIFSGNCSTTIPILNSNNDTILEVIFDRN